MGIPSVVNEILVYESLYHRSSATNYLLEYLWHKYDDSAQFYDKNSSCGIICHEQMKSSKEENIDFKEK